MYGDAVYWFCGCSFFMLNWMFQHGCLDTYCFLGVLYACVFYFRICTCSAQLSMFHMEKRSRNTLIVIIIIIIIIIKRQKTQKNHDSLSLSLSLSLSNIKYFVLPKVASCLFGVRARALCMCTSAHACLCTCVLLNWKLWNLYCRVQVSSLLPWVWGS